MILIQALLIMMAIFAGAFIIVFALYSMGVALERFALGKMEVHDAIREEDI